MNLKILITTKRRTAIDKEAIEIEEDTEAIIMGDATAIITEERAAIETETTINITEGGMEVITTIMTIAIMIGGINKTEEEIIAAIRGEITETTVESDSGRTTGITIK